MLKIKNVLDKHNNNTTLLKLWVYITTQYNIYDCDVKKTIFCNYCVDISKMLRHFSENVLT